MKRRFIFRPPVLVAGSGESGLSAVRLLHALKKPVRMSTLDPLDSRIREEWRKLDIVFEDRGHTEDFIRPASSIIMSPGIPPRSPVVKLARRLRKPVASELDLASQAVEAPWVAVTGSNGKTTTSSLIHAMLSRRMRADLCGNIGASMARSVVSAGTGTPRVVEVSSFQLYYSRSLNPRVGVILNLSPNHLDWHTDLKEYYGAKLKLLGFLGRRGTAVLNADDPILMKMARAYRVRKVYFGSGKVENGIFMRDNVIYEESRRRITTLMKLGAIRLVGAHNRMNILAAVQAARLMGVPLEAIRETIESFEPLPHRTEWVGEWKGVHFVDDSKSTTLASTAAALAGIEGNLVLLVGGRAKERNFKPLEPSLSDRVRQVIIYGEAALLIRQGLRNFTRKQVVENFKDAVKAAFESSRPGDTLLLSPMCSSFDQFASYKERGEAFKQIYRSFKTGGAV